MREETTVIEAPAQSTEDLPRQSETRLAAAGGVLGAIAASSCCLLPLALTIAGVSGAWMANLRMLQPYKPLFALVALAFIAWGFWLVYIRPRRACASGALCERPLIAGPVVKGALWLSLVIVLLAATIDWWLPLVHPYLP